MGPWRVAARARADGHSQEIVTCSLSLPSGPARPAPGPTHGMTIRQKLRSPGTSDPRMAAPAHPGCAGCDRFRQVSESGAALPNCVCEDNVKVCKVT